MQNDKNFKKWQHKQMLERILLGIAIVIGAVLLGLFITWIGIGFKIWVFKWWGIKPSWLFFREF